MSCEALDVAFLLSIGFTPVVSLATSSSPGIVKPDNSTIMVNDDGVISSSGGGGGGTWKVISGSSDYDASAGDLLIVELTLPREIVLPGSPSDGDTIVCWDANGGWGVTTALIINSNGNVLTAGYYGGINTQYVNNLSYAEPNTYVDFAPGDYVQLTFSMEDNAWFAESHKWYGTATGINSAVPNDSIPVAITEAINFLSPNVDMALLPKGIGGLSLLVPDGGAGGNKRGAYAVDLQRSISKGSPTTVASGEYAYCEGNGNTASGGSAHAEGANTIASGFTCHAEGLGTTANGGDGAHSEGQNTVASGESSHAEGYNTQATEFCAHAEGDGSIASNSYAHAEGENTAASGSGSHSEGILTAASGEYSHAEGFNTVADGTASHAGGQNSWTRGIVGAQAYSAGSFANTGDEQCIRLGLRGQTIDATPLALTSDGGSASSINQFALVDNETCFVDVFVLGKVAGAGDCIATQLQVLIQRGIGAASTAIPTTTPTSPAVISIYATAGAISGTWAVALSADTTNGALSVTVTGASATSINWTAEVRSRELVF